MRGRKPVQTTMDKPVPVRLSDDQVLSTAQELAAKVQYVRVLRRKRREDLRAANALIESELDSIEVLAEAIGAQQEIRKQGQLKFGEEEIMGKSEAQEALAKVAQHTGAEDELPPGAPPLADEPADEGETKPEGDDPQLDPVEAGEADPEPGDEDEEDDDEDEPARTPRETAPPAARMGAGARTRAADVPARRAVARGPVQRASSRKAPAASRGKAKGRR